MLEDGVEVARVQLDERGGITSDYAGAPAIDSGELLEIQNIEVRAAVRRGKVATRQGCRPLPSGTRSAD